MRMPHHRQASLAGFTILEMMVVLAIILVAAGMGAVTLSSSGSSNPAQASMMMLKTDLLRAKSLAMRSGIAHSVTFNNADATTTNTPPRNDGTNYISSSNNTSLHYAANHYWAIVKNKPTFTINSVGDGVFDDDIKYDYPNSSEYESYIVGGIRYPVTGAVIAALTAKDANQRSSDGNTILTTNPDDNWWGTHHYVTTHRDAGGTPGDVYPARFPLWHRRAFLEQGNIRVNFHPNGEITLMLDGKYYGPTPQVNGNYDRYTAFLDRRLIRSAITFANLSNGEWDDNSYNIYIPTRGNITTSIEDWTTFKHEDAWPQTGFPKESKQSKWYQQPWN